MVGNGARVHAVELHLIYQLIDLGKPVEQAVMSVDVEVDEPGIWRVARG